MKALITGASSGIGAALARLLSKEGVKLVLSGRNEKRLAEVGNEVGADEIVVADLETKEGKEKVIKALQKHLPDLLINNAGFAVYGPVVSTSVAQQMAILEVNASAPLECTLEYVHALLEKKRPGIVLNVSSAAGEIPMPGMTVYGASKAFLTQFSRALNFELAPKGIHVLVSCPGMVKSDFAERAAGKKIDGNVGPQMTNEQAAHEIWKQIRRRQEKRIFTFFYRFVTWFAKSFVPARLTMNTIWRRLSTRF